MVGRYGADDVRAAVVEAYRRLAEHGIAESRVAGILVEEQADGAEVLVGLSRGDLGSFLTVGAGGVRAGAGTAARTVLLPADRDRVEWALRPFTGPPGTKSMTAAADAVERLAAAFDTGRFADYATVEINPMFVSADRAVIADVLLVKA
jgi:succinyl-CoA synthetase beta subunit